MPKNKILSLILSEIKRQKETLDLIPSENYVSRAVLAALGSPLTNKYSEGYPGKRYYPGNFYYDQIEAWTQRLALRAFRLNPQSWSVNVQPYSGSPANLAVYLALMQPDDRLLGFSLSSGGHLTHGHSASYTGRLFTVKQYQVKPETGQIDYEQLEQLANSFKPKVIVSGTTSYPRKINFRRLGEIAKKVSAYHVADISHIAGLVLAGLHLSPFPYADVVTMTTHKTLRGPRGALIFARKSKTKRQKSKLQIKSQKAEPLISDLIDKSVFPGLQGGPHNHQTAAIGVALQEALQPSFKKYQRQIVKNAQALAAELKKQGFSLYTGGTDNHLMLIDLKPLNADSSRLDADPRRLKADLTQSPAGSRGKLDGKAAEKILEEANIIANRNSLPGDTSPFSPSGLRLGTPAITTRAMKEKEMVKIADWFARLLIKKEEQEKVKNEVLELLKKHPLPY